MSETEWSTVPVHRKKPKNKPTPTAGTPIKREPKVSQTVREVVPTRGRREVPVACSMQKFGAGTNKKYIVSSTNISKLDRETEELRHNKIPLDLGKLIQQSRQAKGLSQKDIATKIFEKQQLVADYEAGRAIPNNVILGKLEKAIGIKLRGKDRGQPIPNSSVKK